MSPLAPCGHDIIKEVPSYVRVRPTGAQAHAAHTARDLIRGQLEALHSSQTKTRVPQHPVSQ